ncbi:MAG: hypothetical protein ACKVN8_00885 [Nitrosarchaeum sp.]
MTITRISAFTLYEIKKDSPLNFKTYCDELDISSDEVCAKTGLKRKIGKRKIQ